MQIGLLMRREFITLIAGIAATWPVAAHAQLSARMRRVAAMMLLAEHDPQQTAWTEAFLRGLREAGWTDRDMQIEYRWGAGDAARARRYAAELVALAPDVILAPGSAGLGPMLQATRDIPIVFVHATPPSDGTATGGLEADLPARWYCSASAPGPRAGSTAGPQYRKAPPSPAGALNWSRSLWT